jgi:hypothetical protein
MTWDLWTFVVLGLAALSSIRPFWATLAHWQGQQAMQRRHSFARAGGGVAMLAMAVYLVTEARQATGRGYWDLVVLAVNTPFMRTLPTVWVPSLCWVLLVVFGCWFLYGGVRGSRGSREPIIAVWAFNEIMISGSFLWWGVYVPDDWTQALLINFGLKGIYVSALAGGVLRLALVMFGPRGGAVHPEEQGLQSVGRAWLGRFRRY